VSIVYDQGQDNPRIDEFREQVETEKLKLGGAEDFNPGTLFHGETDIVSLRSILIFGPSSAILPRRPAKRKRARKNIRSRCMSMPH